MSIGKIIVIVAPSGTGKSTLIKKVKAEFSELLESVSYTTRGIREGEENGVAYNFIDEKTFLKMKDDNEFLEWAKVHSNYYGTSKKFVEGELEKGKKLLFDLDVQGADSFKAYFGDRAQIIFIAPPSILELEKRLRGRGTDSTGVINLRLENAKREVLRKDDYDFCVKNEELDVAFEDLKNTITKILNS
ncbi:guanylate kinase [Halobacteriovorax sp. JY17]|uniref:guanylate kinase n=1 Tax=Halobacteriovorax sp. JY17 TaxID=2014617 RepID=UPI000C46F00F|nr:guanylate kinase [Halobacteriovorax sp. JY17]PIK14814.1 MAG: guanylate kinase [Halobacteriovorax sp. JY17]